MEIDENYGRIEDIRQTLFEIFEDEAKKKNLALHYTINVEHENILTDTTKVKEIFVNILSNAVKYTPAGGSVMVDIDELPLRGAWVHDCKDQGERYRNWYEPGLSVKNFRSIHS